MGKHYSKEITAVILADHAKGATAEETKKHLQDAFGLSPNLNTIYAHRKSITTAQVVDELLRQQERDITKEPNSKIRMEYRDRLLDKLMPLKQEIITKNLTVNKTSVEINVSDMLKQYEDLLEETALLENCAPQPLHPTQANHKAGTVSST